MSFIEQSNEEISNEKSNIKKVSNINILNVNTSGDQVDIFIKNPSDQRLSLNSITNESINEILGSYIYKEDYEFITGKYIIEVIAIEDTDYSLDISSRTDHGSIILKLVELSKKGRLKNLLQTLCQKVKSISKEFFVDVERLQVF